MQRLMRKMGIAALGPKPRTTKPALGHKIFPYLLRGVAVERPTRRISLHTARPRFSVSLALMDWASRAVLTRRPSNAMDVSLGVSVLEEAWRALAPCRSSTLTRAAVDDRMARARIAALKRLHHLARWTRLTVTLGVSASEHAISITVTNHNRVARAGDLPRAPRAPSA
jgi:hypothetical protein